MANEARVTSSLQVIGGETDYQSRPTAFNADVSNPDDGPTPGKITATTAGTTVDLSQVTTPGLCRIQNLSSTYYVEVGAAFGGEFFPLLEALPGESYIVRLSRFLGQELGTGTVADSAAVSLHVRGVGGNCAMKIEAFGK